MQLTVRNLGVACVGALTFAATIAMAEPVGRWWSAWGQGTGEYGYTLPAGAKVYLACDDGSGFGTKASFTIGGVQPSPGQEVKISIDGDTFGFSADEEGDLNTGSRVGDDIFNALWRGIRGGTSMTVNFGGRSATFPLRGAAKVLDEQPCETDWAR